MRRLLVGQLIWLSDVVKVFDSFRSPTINRTIVDIEKDKGTSNTRLLSFLLRNCTILFMSAF